MTYSVIEPNCKVGQSHTFYIKLKIVADGSKKKRKKIQEMTVSQCKKCGVYKIRAYNNKLDDKWFGSKAWPIIGYARSFDARDVYSGHKNSYA